MFGLVGCRGTGTVNVRADDQIEVHIEAWADDPNDPRYVNIDSCEWVPAPGSGLTSTPVEDGGSVGCIVEGTTGMHGVVALIPYVSQHLGDRYLFGVSGAAFQGMVSDPGGNDATLTVTFPGPVLQSSSGTINGNSVTFTDMNKLATEGLAISAMDRPGMSTEQAWMLGAAGLGLVLGAAGAAVVMTLRRKGSDRASDGEQIADHSATRPKRGQVRVDSETSGEEWAPD